MHNEQQSLSLTPHQQRILRLLFKFRFVSSRSLIAVTGSRQQSIYEVLEKLVRLKLVVKVYEPHYRIDRLPAYYYLSKSGVSCVRKIMDVPEAHVHALYKNDVMTNEFITHCLRLIDCYASLIKNQPDGTAIFTKSETREYKIFPKNRPDLYVRTPNNNEAIVIQCNDSTSVYKALERLDEIITHSEDEGWGEEMYPTICFVLEKQIKMKTFLAKVYSKLEGMGIDDNELKIRATTRTTLLTLNRTIWLSPFDLENPSSLS